MLSSFAIISSCTGVPLANAPIFSEVPTEDGKDFEYCYQYTGSDKFGCVARGATFFEAKLMKEPKVIEEVIYNSYLVPDFSYGEIEKMLVKMCIKHKSDCYKEGDPEARAKKFRALMKAKNR